MTALEVLNLVSDVAKMVKDKKGGCRVQTNLGDYQVSKHLHFHVYHEEK